MRLIDADKLAERVANLEAVAIEQVLKYEPCDEYEKWKVWSSILNERTAFKYDLFDAPTVDPVKHGHWIFNPKDAIEMMFTLPKCSECGAESPNGGNYCMECGAKMDEVTDGEIQK